jgi:DNA-binding response OmpR family regulator
MSKPSLYIVEDDAHFRETFIDVMSLRGIEASGAGSAEQALTDLSQTRPSVIVLDVKLPDAHGFDLCKKIKRLDSLKNVPVIMISAWTRYNEASQRAEGAQAGASLFLSKPVTMDKLWAEIETLLQ